MFKSLRWRLQVWHAIVLLAVISSFGGIVHSLHWQTRLQQVDAELEFAAGIVRSQIGKLVPRPRPPRRLRPPDAAKLEGAVQADAQPVLPGALPPDQIAVRPNQGVVARSGPASGSSDPGKPTGEANQVRPPRDRAAIDDGPLPPEFVELFQGNSRYYYFIWDNHGVLLDGSSSAPAVEYPGLHIGPDRLPVLKIKERRADHVYREVSQATMFFDWNVVVGRSLETDIIEHRQSGLMLIAMGFVILAAGVLGGGWLSARAIRPISAMATAAESISAQNLSERINVTETDSELGQLANVLNGTFDRLQAAFERQSQFTADASHELRTPLSVILAHTELALSRTRSSDDYRATIETCRRASQRMKSLIDALLLLVRFDSGTPSIKRDDLDLELVVRDGVEFVRPLALERGIQISCETTSCHVLGDWDRLSQVVTNLLTNAIRYNRENGSLRITTRIEPGYAIISVNDTGIGIAEDQLPYIFDRFYQVDKARSRAEGSCGLGLSICKTIVEAHSGRLQVTSQLGQGTTVEVWLPCATVRNSAEEPEIRKEQLVSATAHA